MSTKAYSYLRVSGDSQVEGDGFPRQRECIAKYAQAHDIEIVQEFRDEGVSGKHDLDHRPGLHALWDALDNDSVKLVLVEKTDRLARLFYTSEGLVIQFQKLGVRVIAADGGTDLTAGDDDQAHRAFRLIMAVFADIDRMFIVGRLRAARDRMRATGHCEGQKAYGARPGEPEALADLQRLRAMIGPKGRPLTYRVLAAEMNARGHKTRHGGLWQAGTIHAIFNRKEQL